MGTPRGLRTSAELSPQPSFPTPPPPVFLLQLRHFLLEVSLPAALFEAVLLLCALALTREHQGYSPQAQIDQLNQYTAGCTAESAFT